VPLPAKVWFYDNEITASLEELGVKAGENEEFSELAGRIIFLVKGRSEVLEQWLTESGPKERRVEEYARSIAMSAFQLTPDVDIEKDERVMRVFERLRFELEAYFNEMLPAFSPRCPVCGKMRNEPRGELIGYQMVDDLHEAYQRQAHQLKPETRELCEQLAGADRGDLIGVCDEFMLKHTVKGVETTGKLSDPDVSEPRLALQLGPRQVWRGEMSDEVRAKIREYASHHVNLHQTRMAGEETLETP